MRKFLMFFCCIATSQLFGQPTIDDTTVSYEEIIYFESNDFSLGDAEKLKLNQLIELGTNLSSYQFYVDAHTDDLGSDSFNLKLSEKRKQSVVDYLIKHEVSSSIIQSNFHGESLRVEMSEDPASRQKNRRALVQLVTKKKLAYLEGQLIDSKTKKGITAEIELSGLNFKNKTKSDSSGHFSILAPLDKSIVLEYVAKEYFIKSTRHKLSSTQIPEVIKVPMVRIEMEKVFTFENMHFEPGLSIMMEKSHRVLHHLKRFMFVNDDVCIEIGGHISDPKARQFRKGLLFHDLSIVRALTVRDALIQTGISSDRILARGYGDLKMKFPNAKTKEQSEQNRRVEIIISDCDSTSTLLDHAVTNRALFAKPALQRLYNEKTIDADTENFPVKSVTDIHTLIEKMKAHNINPESFTYLELLQAFPNLPEQNEF